MLRASSRPPRLMEREQHTLLRDVYARCRQNMKPCAGCCGSVADEGAENSRTVFLRRYSGYLISAAVLLLLIFLPGAPTDDVDRQQHSG